jgi:phenylacetate-coenzyme A ligase PaaK-like adenylate-forming protein
MSDPDMPYLTKQDLAERVYGIERYHPGDPSTRDLALAASSGTTTGRPTLLAMQWPLASYDRAFREWTEPLQSAVRISNNNCRTLRLFHGMLAMDTVDRVMVLEARDMLPENLSQIMGEYKPRSLNGQISQVILFAETLASTGAADLCTQFTRVQTFGEMFTSARQRLLETFFPNAVLQSSYAASEMANSTSRCPSSNEGRYHVYTDAPVSFVIAEPDDQGIGEIIVTTNELANYRTGDLGKLDPRPCPCGESPTLLLYGRKGFDIVPVLGALFLKAELERALEPYLGSLTDYQLRVGEALRNGKRIGKAEFDFVPRKEMTISPIEIAERIARSLFVTKTRTLAELTEVGIFAPLTATRVDAIQRGMKKIPLKRADFSEK